LIQFEKRGLTLKDSLEVEKGKFPNREIQKAYDYFYGSLRLRKRLDYILEKHLRKYKLIDLPVTIRNILRQGAYGILSSRDPDYAVVNQSVDLAKKYGHKGTASLVNGVLRNLHQVEYPEEPLKYLSIFYSFPEFLVKKIMNAYGEDTERILEASNKVSPTSIRVNRLKTTPAALIELLKEEGIRVTKCKESDYNLLTEGNVLYTKSFREGLFQVQGVTQTINTEILAPEKGEIILDLCSAPGTKSTGIAELMGDDGLILSVDIKDLDKVVSNCRRLGIKSVYPIQADVRGFNVRSSDRILLDVPCSGSGVMAQRGALRWRITLDSLKRLKTLQMELLNASVRNMKSGGILVYATCSILPEENEDQIYRFLKENSDFTIEWALEDKPFFINFPGGWASDGGFGAIIRRR